LGIEIHLNTEPTEIEKVNGKYVIEAKKNGEQVKFECDGVFHGAGRIPDVDDLDLEKGNVTIFGRKAPSF